MSYQKRITELRGVSAELQGKIGNSEKKMIEGNAYRIVSDYQLERLMLLVEMSLETANDAQREIVQDLDKHVKASFADIGKEFTKFKYSFKSISVHDLGRLFQRAASSQKSIAEGLHLTL